MNNMDQLVRIAQNLTPYKVKALIWTIEHAVIRDDEPNE